MMFDFNGDLIINADDFGGEEGHLNMLKMGCINVDQDATFISACEIFECMLETENSWR